jgi:hypothetical protein
MCGGDRSLEARKERAGRWSRLGAQGRNERQMKIGNKIKMRSIYTSVRMLEKSSRGPILYHVSRFETWHPRRNVQSVSRAEITRSEKMCEVSGE